MECNCKKTDDSHYTICREHWDMFIESIRNAKENSQLESILNTPAPWEN